jgi:fucose permease
MDMISKSFFYPTFTPYLVETYGLSIESSSIFFVINMASYLLMLQFVQEITHRLGLKLTMVTGLMFNFIGILFLPPVSILPQYKMLT